MIPQEQYEYPEKDKLVEDAGDALKIIVDPKQTPIRLDKFLFDRLQTSRNRIQEAIRDGSVTVDMKAIKVSHKVRPGEIIRLVIPKPDYEDSFLVPQDIPLDIHYEDEDLLVVHKPPGMVVHPGVGHWTGTLVNALAYYLGEELPVMEGNPTNRIGLVHRIDKDTSGLLLVAKTSEAMTHLARQFFDHTVERTYYALVWGDVEEDKGTIDQYIGRDEKNRQNRKVYPEKDKGKHAITHYEVLERMYYTTLIKCNLETGRTHQIRVHMSYLGHPLFNDNRYGGDRIRKGTIFSKYKQYVDKIFTVLPRQALHAKSLGFTHPRTGERMQFDSDLPEDMTKGMEMWRSYVAQRKQKNNLV